MLSRRICVEKFCSMMTGLDDVNLRLGMHKKILESEILEEKDAKPYCVNTIEILESLSTAFKKLGIKTYISEYDKNLHVTAVYRSLISSINKKE